MKFVPDYDNSAFYDPAEVDSIYLVDHSDSIVVQLKSGARYVVHEFTTQASAEDRKIALAAFVASFDRDLKHA